MVSLGFSKRKAIRLGSPSNQHNLVNCLRVNRDDVIAWLRILIQVGSGESLVVDNGVVERVFFLSVVATFCPFYDHVSVSVNPRSANFSKRIRLYVEYGRPHSVSLPSPLTVS